MTDISKLTDKELMDEVYKRNIPFITNVKIIINKDGFDGTIKPLNTTSEGVSLHGVTLDYQNCPLNCAGQQLFNKDKND